jgi:hypothetical protein
VNPWSRTDSKGEEAWERALFERRAEALPPAVVPAVADVLRAADDRREVTRARWSSVTGGLLAAACLAAALTALPKGPPRGRTPIAPDLASTVVAPESETEGAGMCAEERPCTAAAEEPPPCHESRDTAAGLASSDDALSCVAPEPFAALQTVLVRSPCPAETSCAIAIP